MFHRVIATEHKDDGIIVINYAPGPLDTQMQQEIRESSTVKVDTKEYFANMKLENKLVNPLDSANKLVKLLDDELFVSGSHFDYYDELPVKLN